MSQNTDHERNNEKQMIGISDNVKRVVCSEIKYNEKCTSNLRKFSCFR